MRTAHLSDVAVLDYGFAFDSRQFNIEGRGLPLVRIRDVVPGRSDTYYSGEYNDRYLVSDGDYLIGMDGQFNLARWQGGKALLNQRVCRIGELDESVDRAYLARFMPVALKAIEDATPFVTVKHLSAKALNAIRVPLPSLDEQRRIAAILDQADSLRAKRRHVLAHLDALPQSIFHEMFPAEGDSAASVGNLVSDGLIGLVRGAAEVRPDMSIPYMKMDAITRSGGLDRGALTATEAGAAERKRFEAHDGDLMFNTRNSRELVGKTTVFRGEPALFNNNLMRIRFREGVDPVYVHAYLWSPEGRRQLEARKSGTTSVFAIYAKDLMTISVPLPPVELQRLFSDRVELVAAQGRAVQRALATDAALLVSLQSRAFRGQL